VLVQELNREKDIHVELRHEFSKARADLSRQFIQNRLTQPLQEAIRPSGELIYWLRAFQYGEIAEIEDDMTELGF
jgi:hypothetical protein